MNKNLICNIVIAGTAFALCGVAIGDPNGDKNQTGITQGFNKSEAGTNTWVTNIIQRFAKEGDADAQYTLGTLYRSGTGVPKNEGKAFKWYQKAAEQGMADAQYNLGLMYASGDGVTEDNSIAVDWIFRAAQQGHKDAEFTFNLMSADDFEIGC